MEAARGRSDLLGEDETTAWHGLVGRFSATVVRLAVSRAVVRSWLHSGLCVPDGDEAQPCKVFLYLGRQQSVSPAVFGLPIRIPFCFRYPEIIVAAPDLQWERAGAPPAGPVTYLPKLFLGSWGSTLLGRCVYGISKSYARFDVDGSRYGARDRRGRQLLSAVIETSDRSAGSADVGGLQPDFDALLPQPVVVGKGQSLHPVRLAFDQRSLEIRPVRVRLEAPEGLVSWLPEIRRTFRGCDEEDGGAFQMSADWTLKRLRARAGEVAGACAGRVSSTSPSASLSLPLPVPMDLAAR